MVVIRKCKICGNSVDASAESKELICDECKEKRNAEEYTEIQEIDQGMPSQIPESREWERKHDPNGYYRPRWSGSLAYIERDGETKPGSSYEDMLDSIIANAVSQYRDTRNGEAQTITAAFSKSGTNKFGIPKKVPEQQKQQTNRVSGSGNSKKKNNEQDNALAKFLDQIFKR